MYLTDFAEQRGQKPDTVAKYIRDHAAEFEGHTSMDGKQKVLDEVAVELLGKKYPLPQQTVIYQNEEYIRELEKTLAKAALDCKKYLEELREADELKYKIGTVKTQMALLEADIKRKDELLDKANQELQEEKAQHAATQQQLSSVESELTSAKQEIERLKNRSIFDFLFKK